MTSFLATRVLRLVLVWIGITLGTFGLLRLSGDPARLILGELGNWPNKPYRPVVYPPLPWIFPPEIDSLSKMGNITLGLLARGYSDDDARKIMGGNFLRVFSEVWR